MADMEAIEICQDPNPRFSVNQSPFKLLSLVCTRPSHHAILDTRGAFFSTLFEPFKRLEMIC